MSEAYSFHFVTGLNFSDPFGGSVSEPNLTGLGTLTNTALNTAYNFSTDNSGQMAELQLPSST